MKTITVKHEVSPGRESCEFGGDFWGQRGVQVPYVSYSNPRTQGSTGVQKTEVFTVRLLA